MICSCQLDKSSGCRGQRFLEAGVVALVHFYPGVFNFFSHPVPLLRWWTVLGLMSDQALKVRNNEQCLSQIWEGLSQVWGLSQSSVRFSVRSNCGQVQSELWSDDCDLLNMFWVFSPTECLRPYHVESTSSRPITEVKQRWVVLVLGWVTAWEYTML